MDPTYTQPGGLTARDPEAQKFLDFLWRCNNSEVFKCMEMESFTGILTSWSVEVWALFGDVEHHTKLGKTPISANLFEPEQYRRSLQLDADRFLSYYYRFMLQLLDEYPDDFGELKARYGPELVRTCMLHVFWLVVRAHPQEMILTEDGTNFSREFVETVIQCHRFPTGVAWLRFSEPGPSEVPPGITEPEPQDKHPKVGIYSRCKVSLKHLVSKLPGPGQSTESSIFKSVP